MHIRLISSRTWPGLALLVWLSACTSAVTPVTPGSDREAARIEQLARDGQHRDAAAAYERLAQNAPGELRDRFLLRAAREHVRADDLQRAEQLLNQVSSTLPTADFSLRAMVVAEIALRSQRPERALTELDRIPQPLARDLASDVLALRARAQFALNRPAAAVDTALERERALTRAEDVRANQQLIWEGLRRSAANNADFRAPSDANPIVAGWLDLGRAALVAARNPFTAQQDLAAWRARYPTHPANSLLEEDVLPRLGVGLEYPTQVALVLPLSGRTQAAGIAIRDGFMAALYEQDPNQRPLIKVYDSNEMGATTAYRRAIADGAQFVVGPLLKEDVAALAASSETSVLTLALNQLADDAVPPPLMFQYALDPEEEARQVAQRAVTDGHRHAAVLLPNNEWGQRLFRAFDTEIKALGGAITGLRFYDPEARDYSQPIIQLMLLDESRARANALSSVLGTRLEFEPRHRGDADFIFMGAQPVQGRSLKPALRFHIATDLPVYATSDIFEPDTPANHDLEGLIFPDAPWVISPDSVSSQLRNALGRHWPVRARGRGRLYAFGFDAYRIIPLLKAGRFGSQYAVPGMTGQLSVDENGRVRRELDWARIYQGKAIPLGSNPSAALR